MRVAASNTEGFVIEQLFVLGRLPSALTHHDEACGNEVRVRLAAAEIPFAALKIQAATSVPPLCRRATVSRYASHDACDSTDFRSHSWSTDGGTSLLPSMTRSDVPARVGFAVNTPATYAQYRHMNYSASHCGSQRGAPRGRPGPASRFNPVVFRATVVPRFVFRE
jgi:hypothetical protein